MLRHAEFPTHACRCHRGRSGEIIAWDGENGGKVADWLERSKRGESFYLEKLLTRPEVDDEVGPYFAAFRAIGRDRPMLGGMGVVVPLPVPGWVIESYLRRIGIGDSEIAEFVEIVAAIDDEFVDREAKRILAETKANASKKNKKGNRHGGR